MESQDNTHSQKRNTILIIARIFISLLALFFLLAFGPKLIGQYFGPADAEPLSDGTWQGWVMEITFYVFFIGFIFSWWKKCIGGILILLAAVIQMGPFLIIDGNMGSLIFGVPLLISGVFFLVVCGRQAQ